MNLIDDITKLQLIYLQKAHKTKEKHEKRSFQKYFTPFICHTILNEVFDWSFLYNMIYNLQ